MFSRVAGGLKFAAPGVTGYVGVKDVISAMTQLMDSDISGERFILNSGDFSYKEVFEWIASSLGQSRELKSVKPSTLRSLSRMDSVLGFFTGKRRITSEQVKAAFNQARFSNEKVREAIGMKFSPMEDIIEHVAGHYRTDFPLKH